MAGSDLLHIGAYHNGNHYVFVANYPLAPPGAIKGQYAIRQVDPDHSGRYPQQTRAVEAFVSAAKADQHC